MSLLGASFSAVLQQQAAAVATQQVITQTVQATAVQVVDPVSNTPEPIASTHLADTTSLVRQSELAQILTDIAELDQTLAGVTQTTGGLQVGPHIRAKNNTTLEQAAGDVDLLDLATRFIAAETSVTALSTTVRDEAEINALVDAKTGAFRNETQINNLIAAQTKTDAELSTFIGNHANVRNEIELSAVIENHANVRDDTELSTFIANHNQVSKINAICLSSPRLLIFDGGKDHRERERVSQRTEVLTELH